MDMLNEEVIERIKNAIININGKDYIKVKKDTFKSLGYRYNIFTKKWKRTKLRGNVRNLKVVTVKQDKNTYLVEMDIEALSKPLASWYIAPYIAELVE